MIQAESIVLALGARERTRGNIMIPGDRSVGVWTAGSAQKYLNIDGYSNKTNSNVTLSLSFNI